MKSNEKFLVVDDDDLMLDTLQNCISMEGFDVVTASSGLMAIEIAGQNEFDVIISDVMMPGLNGIETIKAVKEIHPTIHSIVITGYASNESPIKAIKVGVDDYINKPFDLDDFAHTIRRNVDNLRMRRHLQLRQREMEAAQTVQHLLLPKELPQTPQLATAARYAYSMGLGGDYYDVINLGHNRFALLMGDVSGHDIASALVMVMVRTLAHSLVHDSESPAALLEKMTRQIHQDISQALYVCLFLGFLDLEKEELLWSNSGAPPGYLIKSSGEMELLRLNSVPLGIFEEGQYEDKVTPVSKGDCLWFYTDGVVDTVDEKDEFYGEERLEHFLKQSTGQPVGETLRLLWEELENFRKKTPLLDDYTMLGVQLL